jgi:hypothetical protein
MAKRAQIVQEQNDYSVVDVADNSTTVYTGACTINGVYINTVLSAHALPIKDGTVTVVTIPASAAAGTHYPLPGIKFTTSLVVDPDDSATGGVVVAYRPVNPDFVDGLTAITPAS